MAHARTVILDTVVRNVLDSAERKWSDAERAWIAVEWTLAHDPYVGVPLTEKGDVRGFRYDGARSIGQPDIEVIYVIQEHEIIVRDAVFSDAKASQAGLA